MDAASNDIILDVRNLFKHFPITKGFIFQKQVGAVKAVDGISFNIRHGETLGLVGESGCGKTTTGRVILRLMEPTSGEASFEGRDIFKLKKEELRLLRRNMQIIFQDPYSSLNPRMTVGDIVGEPLEIHNLARGKEKLRRVQELLEIVGLAPYHANRYRAGCRNCWRSSAWRPTTPTATRTSSPAGSGSASASPGRWR